MLANIAAHCAQLHWVALKLQYCANIRTILSYRPIFIQYVNIVPIFSQYCLLVGTVRRRIGRYWIVRLSVSQELIAFLARLSIPRDVPCYCKTTAGQL